MTTATQTNTNTNEAQKNEGKENMSQVNAQASDTSVKATAEVTKNTSWSEFQRVVDKVIKDFKADNQELEMIVSMVPVQDVLSKDNIAKLIKGDTLIYTPKARANASATSKPKATSANQQRGALLELLPHYKDLVADNDRSIVSVDSEYKLAVKAAKSGQKLSEKQEKALMAGAKASTVKKNASKGEAELKIDAIEKMFSRAIAKLYYLRRVQAQEVSLNAKQKTITFTGYNYEVNTDGGKTKVKLFSVMGEYTKTLAELKRDSNTFLKADGVTSIRGSGKGASATKTAPSPEATATLNPIQTTADNSKVLSGMVKAIIKSKDKGQIAAYKNAEAPKVLFSDMVQALFITDGTLDLPALQKAIDNAMGKGKVARKVLVQYGSDIEVKQSA